MASLVERDLLKSVAFKHCVFGFCLAVSCEQETVAAVCYE